MNVKIKTVFGEMSFNMEEDKALTLLGLAISYSQDGGNVGTDQRNDALPALSYAVDAAARLASASVVGKPTQPPASKTDAKSRLEKLFGAKSEWKMSPSAEPAPTPDVKSDNEAEEREGYKGFLYVECEKCKRIKGFCVKTPITQHVCICGHATELRDLIPAHVKCECDSRFTYQTNLQTSTFTIECLHCGSPVDMELGAKAKAFVTIGRTGSRT